MIRVEVKKQYGYVGAAKRPSRLYKVNGRTYARVFESNRRPGTWTCEVTFNGGRSYLTLLTDSKDKVEETAMWFTQKRAQKEL
jgi:hypothetical protein